MEFSICYMDHVLMMSTLYRLIYIETYKIEISKISKRWTIFRISLFFYSLLPLL